MGVNLITAGDELLLGRRQFGFFDDFFQFTTGDRWTSIEADSGASTSKQNEPGGEIDLITGATDNNEVYIHTTNEIFKLADGKTLMCEARIQYAEAATSAANIIFGFLSGGFAANHLADTGGGPPGTYDGACFFKVDGGTNWQVESSDNTSQTTTELTALNSEDSVAKTAGGSSYQTLAIEITPTSSTRMDVAFFIDGKLVKKHNETYETPAVMDLGIGVKAGSGTSETLTVDYIAAYQLR